MPKNQLSYLELPATNVAALKGFYSAAFGWTHQDFGPDYATAHGSGLEVGYNGTAQDKTKAPLALVETDDITAAEEQVRAAGGSIIVPTFSYPGGKRFHFTDPAGNELGVYQAGA